MEGAAPYCRVASAGLRHFVGAAGAVGFADVVQGDLIELLAARRGILAGDAGLAELIAVGRDGAGDRLDRQIAERIGAQRARPSRPALPRSAGRPCRNLRREQLADRRHVDAVEARRDDRRAGHADVNLAGPAQLANPLEQHPHRRRADDRVLDQEHPLAFEHFAQRRVLGLGLALAAAAAFDERAAGVAVADQPFDATARRAGRPSRRPRPCWCRARARRSCPRRSAPSSSRASSSPSALRDRYTLRSSIVLATLAK